MIAALADDAARSTAIAEAALLDASITHNDRVRLSNAARRSRLELRHAIAPRPTQSGTSADIAAIFEGAR